MVYRGCTFCSVSPLKIVEPERLHPLTSSSITPELFCSCSRFFNATVALMTNNHLISYTFKCHFLLPHYIVLANVEGVTVYPYGMTGTPVFFIVRRPFVTFSHWTPTLFSSEQLKKEINVHKCCRCKL